MTCPKCGKEKKTENDLIKGVRKRQCKQCVKEWHAAHYRRPDVKLKHAQQGRDWRAANKHRDAEYSLKSLLKTKYGLTVGEYYELLEHQGGVCAICGSASSKRSKSGRLFVDHDHKTGRVRGLLCHRCNLAVGWHEDDPSRADAIRTYLS